MNNKELAAELAKRLGKTSKEITQLLAITTQQLVDSMQEDTQLAIQGFGAFEVRKKQDRVLINPSTKQKMIIPPKLSLVFKMGNTYKEKLKKIVRRGE